MSLSTKSVSLRHHGCGPGGKGGVYLSHARAWVLHHCTQGEVLWVRTAQGLLWFTHPNAHEFANDSPEELKVQVRLVPLNPFPPATHPFPYYIANSMQNWDKNAYARSLVKPWCWRRLQVCTERIDFVGMENHPATSADIFSWAPPPQLPSGSLGKTITHHYFSFVLIPHKPLIS